MVPVIQHTMQALADISAAVAMTGVRAHAGNLVLARVTSHMQRARPLLRAYTAHLSSSNVTPLLPRVKLLLCQGGHKKRGCTQHCESACPCVQILLEGVTCYPAQGASCLSAEYAWQQLMPDFAALVRSLCVAVGAWPPEVPKP